MIDPDEANETYRKGFPSFSRHLGNKATEEGQGMVITQFSATRPPRCRQA